MQISSYNSLYELSAALCSAFVGIAYIPEYILSHLEVSFNYNSHVIQESKRRIRIGNDQLNKYFQDNYTVSRPLFGNHGSIESVLKTSGDYLLWFANAEKLFVLENEADLIKKKVFGLFIQTFFYNCILIIIGGFQQDKIIDENTTINFLFFFNLVFILNLVVLSQLIIKYLSRTISMSVYLFCTTLLVAVLSSKYIKVSFARMELSSIILSFLMLGISILIIVSRILWWKRFGQKFKKKCVKADEFYHEVSKLIMNEVV